MSFKKILSRIKNWLQGLSFRTGVIVMALCLPCYFISLGLPWLLDMDASKKGAMFVVFFGLAKTFQYAGLTILGKEGYRRLKAKLKGNKPVRLIIFDFDGTIGDSRGLITRTMLETIDRLGLEKRTEEECARTIGLPLAECFSSMIPMTDEKAEECARVYTEICLRNSVPGAVPAFPNVVETIRNLHSQGYILTIATNRSRQTLTAFLNDMQLADCFRLLVGVDDVQQKKPNAEPALKILDTFGLKANQALIVGDTESDIVMGKNAGIRTCGVTYGTGTEEDLKKSGADFIINDFSELTGIVSHSANGSK